ncbi:hypothetical protein KNO15_17450 [Leifsonia shinshuensis]|uniref:DUF3885 domain-containing protein n=1 Tax=Leifsonia shinshuensis TaxID=150026 RepID=UPI001F51210F|nr:hypothetical protein [Leifsonia shinshuensis]MCI0158491.1 hypothetical protein [Leifsonia shinshuensis]
MLAALGRISRRRRRLGGDFDEPESSDRARRLTARWNEVWPGSEPAGHLLRYAYAERWVRFHSLPDGKRYAETTAESDAILDRHLTVLRELLASEESSALVLIAQEWDRADLAGGWTRTAPVAWWPWRTHTEPDEDGLPSLTTYFWAADARTPTDLAPLLRLVADDRAHLLVAPPSLEWIYAPYDGGADIVLADRSRRDGLAAAHPDWLSPRPDGL